MNDTDMKNAIEIDIRNNNTLEVLRVKGISRETCFQTTDDLSYDWSIWQPVKVTPMIIDEDAGCIAILTKGTGRTMYVKELTQKTIIDLVEGLKPEFSNGDDIFVYDERTMTYSKIDISDYEDALTARAEHEADVFIDEEIAKGEEIEHTYWETKGED